MKKKIWIIMLVLVALCLFSENILAAEKHWAEGDLHNLKSKYQIEVREDLDQPAGKELQEKILKLTGIKKRPQNKLSRFKIFHYMVEELAVKTLSEQECREILRDFQDTCAYCKKSNEILGKAKKAGLLRGRSTVGGLIMSIDKPVTRAELGVLAVRYLKIKETLK
ncbi:MAG: hypothetical protein PHC81_05710 [Clostridia bacterium]|nr:hypothetical protein [Clostridia bacterium]